MVEMWSVGCGMPYRAGGYETMREAAQAMALSPYLLPFSAVPTGRRLVPWKSQKSKSPWVKIISLQSP